MARETRYDTTSQFPTAIDNLLFLNDIDLEHITESNYQNQLALAGLYSQSSDYLEKTATMDSICASLFNLIENRIYATQTYLMNKHTAWYDVYGVDNPISADNEPADKTKQPVWTGGGD